MAALWIRYSGGGGPVRINIDGMGDVMDLVQYLCTTQPELNGVGASQVTVHSPDDSRQYDLEDNLLTLGQTSSKNPLIIRFSPPQQYGTIGGGSSSPPVKFPAATKTLFEGLPDANQNPCIPRTELVNKIADTMSDPMMTLLITSPSFTGKTALANLMYNYWKKSGTAVHFVSFAGFKRGEDLNEFIFARTRSTVSQIMNSDCILILDETQKIYDDTTFWENLKSGALSCRVLAFGVFGLSAVGDETSPSQFREKWYYDDIKFSNGECADLVESFARYQPRNREILVPDVIGDLFQFLNNHPGLVYMALHTFCYEFTHTPFDFTGIYSIQRFIAEGHLLSRLFGSARCFSVKYDKIKKMLGANADQIMYELLTHDSIPLEKGDSTLPEIHKAGICIADRDEKTLRFSSEVMRIFYRQLYYGAVYGVDGSKAITNWSNETPHTLLKRVLQLFNSRVLASSLSKGADGRLYERIYQNEFYRCCYMLAPKQCHPDVGAVYGTRGFLDFYLGGDKPQLQWGYELMRNGDRLRSHIERFNPESGRYKDIPLADYALVDFYEADDNKQACSDKYYKVVFSDDYKTIRLSHNGSIEDIICGQ